MLTKAAVAEEHSALLTDAFFALLGLCPLTLFEGTGSLANITNGAISLSSQRFRL